MNKIDNRSMNIAELFKNFYVVPDYQREYVDAPRYKDYILPLIFMKRLSDVFDDEIEKLAEEYGHAGKTNKRNSARWIREQDFI